MRRKNAKIYLILSLSFAIFFLSDAVAKIFVFHAPARILWYSTLGLLLVSLALITESSFLVTTAICTLFFLEGLWTVGFFYFVLFHGQLIQISTHAFSVNFRDFVSFVTLYHLLFIPSLIYALLNLKKVSRFGWIGACFFAVGVGILSFIFAGGHDNINCIYSVNNCIRFLGPIYKISNPFRILTVVFLLTLFVYIPTNIILWQVRKSG